MQIQVRLGDGDARRVDMVRRAGFDTIWESSDPDILIAAELGEAGAIKSLTLGEIISSSREEVAELFLTALAEVIQTEAAGIEFSPDELAEPDTPFPYDPDAIRVDTKQFNIGLIHEMIGDGDINLSPDFQRRFVWTDLGTRSRLIESIMLRIPLPVFYMAQDAAGRLHVVDGLQRLTVIKQFLDSKLRLRELEYLKDENGKVFRHEDETRCINQKYRKRILQTQIMVNIIDPQTPPVVKFDIFKRINEGGRPLNSQEMRNCMSLDATRHLIANLAESPEFLEATGNSVGTVRMQDQELVLRFLAFCLSEMGTMSPYPGNMVTYLDATIDVLNERPSLHEALAEKFKQSMRNALHLFSEFAFRKCETDDLGPGRRRRLINTSYFTTWSTVLANYSGASVARLGEGYLASVVAKRLEIDDKFRDAVTSGTNDRRRLDYAFTVAKELCEREIQ